MLLTDLVEMFVNFREEVSKKHQEIIRKYNGILNSAMTLGFKYKNLWII